MSRRNRRPKGDDEGITPCGDNRTYHVYVLRNVQKAVSVQKTRDAVSDVVVGGRGVPGCESQQLIAPGTISGRRILYGSSGFRLILSSYLDLFPETTHDLGNLRKISE